MSLRGSLPLPALALLLACGPAAPPEAPPAPTAAPTAAASATPTPAPTAAPTAAASATPAEPKAAPRVAEIAVGGAHACARYDDGAVRCWGSNKHGQLGDGSTTARASAAPVPGLSGVARISAGAGHTCAALADGGVRCWGDNRKGQLGLPASIEQQPTPTAVPGVAGAAEVGAGGAHTCARVTGGDVLCWGGNEHGQLGRPPKPKDHAAPAPAAPFKGALALAVGGSRSCARLDKGAVACAGDARTGPVFVPLGPSSKEVPNEGATHVAAGWDHTCAIAGDTVRCWGGNSYGVLGVEGAPYNVMSFVALPGATAVTAGKHHTCVLVAGGKAQCWGNNDDGALGTGKRGGSITPVAVAGLEGALQIGAGDGFTCARLGDGVRCWGKNKDGQVGDGSHDARRAPAAVTGL